MNSLVTQAQHHNLSPIPSASSDAICVVQDRSDGRSFTWQPQHPSDLPPTLETYGPLQIAYDVFNNALFCGGLPQVLITLQRKKRTRAYFCAHRFQRRAASGDVAFTHEVAFNPLTLQERTDIEIASTLVHEMCHVWQFEFGRPSRGGYHNHEWAAKMIEVGLRPTDTGLPGGNVVGPSMTHLIVSNGRFETVCLDLLDQGFRIAWQDRAATVTAMGSAKASGRVKFSCPCCYLSAWAKPSAALRCESCDRRLIAAGAIGTVVGTWPAPVGA